jgi:opine dehydrogenase
MNNKNVAILGGGSIALAASVDLSSRGFKINLLEHPNFKENIQSIIEKGGVGYSGVIGEGFAKLNMVTTDPGKALKDVKVILLATPVFAHETFLKACLPFLQNGQILLIETGYFGCLRFAKMIKDTGKKIILAELNITPYTCTRTGPAKIYIDDFRKWETYLATLPAGESKNIINIIRDIHPDTAIAPNVIQTSLDNANYMVHAPIILLHRGLFERETEVSLPIKDLLTPSVLALTDEIEREGQKLGEAFGVDVPPLRHLWNPGAKSYRESLGSAPSFETFEMVCKDASNVYMKEDLYCSLPAIASLSNLVKVPTPVIKAIIDIFSVIDGIDYIQEGVNVENMGLAGLSSKEVLNLVEEGY